MAQVLFLYVSNESEEDTYEGIVDEVLGKIGSWYLGIAMAVTNCIANAAHLGVCAGLLHELIMYFFTGGVNYEYPILWYHKMVIIGIIGLIVLPLSFERNLNSLR